MSEKLGFTKFLEKIKWWIGIIALLGGTITYFHVEINEYLTGIGKEAINEKNQSYNDSVDNVIRRNWIEYSIYIDTPDEFIQEMEYLQYQIDSIGFITKQMNTVLFKAFMQSKMVLDSHGCKYYLRVDPMGGLWWRARYLNENDRKVKTYPYKVHYNSTIDSYEYTDVYGNVQTFKHKYED